MSVVKEVNEYGTICYYQEGKLHRTDGPAIEYAAGTKEYYQYGMRHRTDGPAIVWDNGTKVYYQNDELHRTDGPAREYANGTKRYYVCGVRLSLKLGAKFTRKFSTLTAQEQEIALALLPSLLATNPDDVMHVFEQVHAVNS